MNYFFNKKVLSRLTVIMLSLFLISCTTLLSLNDKLGGDSKSADPAPNPNTNYVSANA